MKPIHTVVMLAALLLLAMVTGCANDQAVSDWHWQQLNPTWKPTMPADSAAQEGMSW